MEEPTHNSETENWYAVYTLPRAEKSLSKLFRKYKIESFLPLVPTKRKWSDRWKIIDLPLFSSYVFVKIPFWKEKAKILMLPGSHHFIFHKGTPATIPEEDIELLRIMVSSFPDRIKSEQKEALQPGKKVKILTGPFQGHSAEIIKLQTKVTILVKFPMMNQLVSAEFHIDDLSWEQS